MMKQQGLQKMIIAGLVLLFTTGFYTSCSNNGNEFAPTGLMTDLLLHPEKAVITNPSPKFSWIVNGRGNGVMQKAYQILIASDPELLEIDNADKWDSGKVNSDQSIAVPYKNDNLDENTSYWWKVRTWDQNGEASSYSSPQKFNKVGFLLCNGEKIEGKDLNDRILIEDVRPGNYIFEIRKN